MTKRREADRQEGGDLEVLKKRLDRLEKELEFIREHGMSEEEQSILLQKDEDGSPEKYRAFTWLVVLNVILILICFFFTYVLCFKTPCKDAHLYPESSFSFP